MTTEERVTVDQIRDVLKVVRRHRGRQEAALRECQEAGLGFAPESPVLRELVAALHTGTTSCWVCN